MSETANRESELLGGFEPEPEGWQGAQLRLDESADLSDTLFPFLPERDDVVDFPEQDDLADFRGRDDVADFPRREDADFPGRDDVADVPVWADVADLPVWA